MCKADAVARSSRANLRIGGERTFATKLVVDDRLRIARVEPDARARKFERRRVPGLVDGGVRQCRQLRYPAPDIAAVGVKRLGLQDRIEHPEIGRGIGAAAGDPLPVGGIAAWVG